MCYSARLWAEYREMCKKLRVDTHWHDFLEVARAREKEFDDSFRCTIKIPDELIAGLVALDGSAAKELALIQRRWKVKEQRQLEQAMNEADVEFQVAEEKLKIKATKTNQKAFEVKQRKLDKAKAALENAAKPPGDSYRIYPFYFAPIIIEDAGKRLFVPARFRILPRTGIEVPNNYNVFNSRRDSLQSARNWIPLFGKQHAIFPFQNFYEWVERDGKSVEIKFSPDGHDGMHAASLYEIYQHPELGQIRSFSMVTDEPPPEVAAAGHDRCPVFLSYDKIDQWLNPAGQTLQQLDELLDHKERAYYSHVLAA
jgi:putative SOS response-associated peptidase YedK